MPATRSARPPRLRSQAVSVPLRSDGTLTLACVADTHSLPHPATAERLAAIAPDAILHAGDIGDHAVIDALAGTAPVYAVRGNIDTRSTFPDVFTIDITDDATSPVTGEATRDAIGPARRLRILMTHIAVAGPRLRSEVARMARTEGAQLVVCGHSHVPFIGRDRDLTVFNPGSIGPRRFHLPIVFGTVKITPASVRLAHIDCETGQAWTPP
jgi:putative phosphoesterase